MVLLDFFNVGILRLEKINQTEYLKRRDMRLKDNEEHQMSGVEDKKESKYINKNVRKVRCKSEVLCLETEKP